MTLYNVHIYREMRLFFEGIEADTPHSRRRDRPRYADQRCRRNRRLRRDDALRPCRCGSATGLRGRQS